MPLDLDPLGIDDRDEEIERCVTESGKLGKRDADLQNCPGRRDRLRASAVPGIRDPRPLEAADDRSGWTVDNREADVCRGHEQHGKAMPCREQTLRRRGAVKSKV